MFLFAKPVRRRQRDNQGFQADGQERFESTKGEN